MFQTASLLSILSASTIVLAHDTGARLTKPALANNLDYLEEGLVKNLPLTPYTVNKWDPGYIPSECKKIASGEIEDSVKYDPADFEIYDVHYSDCGDPWVFCHHKDSNITLDSMASQFSRLPIQMREWVRHVIDVPSDNGWAFEWDGSITFIRPVDDMFTTIVHETGHSLDLSGAYKDKSLSDSDNWWNNYDQDTHVPDPYAQSNMVEDVAQNTVVALYNENVPGGFGGVEPGWQSIFHQYATLITEAREAGDGNSIIVPGQSQTCSHRMPSSDPVPVDGNTRRSGSGMRSFVPTNKPDVSLKSGVRSIDTSSRKQKRSDCQLKL